MTRRPLAALLLAAGLGSLAGDPDAHAQGFFFGPSQPSYQPEYAPPRPSRRERPREQRPYGYQQPYGGYDRRYQPQQRYGGYPSPSYAPAPPPTEFRWPWERQAPAPAPVPGYERRPRIADEAPREIRKRRPPRPPPAVVQREHVVKPKVATATLVGVFGDALAELVAQGLETSYEEDREMAVLRKTRGDSGLVRSDVMDWPKAVQDFLQANPKTAYAIVLLGANDSQPIKEGEQSHEPLSDRWRELYRDRVDAVLKAFSEKGVAVVWVGAPPVRNERLSTEISALNEIYRDRVQRAGGVYVDIWPGFVNDQNRYTPIGPDVEGQSARLRTADGVSFTKAGARKAAHFASVEVKRLMEAKRGVPAPAADPAIAKSGPDAPAAPEATDADKQLASLPAPAEPLAPLVLPQRPLAGPVVPLTRTDVSPGAALATGRPKLDGDPAQSVERALRSGIVAPPPPGRADDYKWPPS